MIYIMCIIYIYIYICIHLIFCPTSPETQLWTQTQLPNSNVRHISIVNVWILKGNVVQKHFLRPGAQLWWDLKPTLLMGWDGWDMKIWAFSASKDTPKDTVYQPYIIIYPLLNLAAYHEISTSTQQCGAPDPFHTKPKWNLGRKRKQKIAWYPHSAPIHHEKKNTPFTKIKSQNLGLSENGVYPHFDGDFCKGKWWLPSCPWISVPRSPFASLLEFV